MAQTGRRQTRQVVVSGLPGNPGAGRQFCSRGEGAAAERVDDPGPRPIPWPGEGGGDPRYPMVHTDEPISGPIGGTAQNSGKPDQTFAIAAGGGGELPQRRGHAEIRAFCPPDSAHGPRHHHGGPKPTRIAVVERLDLAQPRLVVAGRPVIRIGLDPEQDRCGKIRLEHEAPSFQKPGEGRGIEREDAADVIDQGSDGRHPRIPIALGWPFRRVAIQVQESGFEAGGVRIVKGAEGSQGTKSGADRTDDAGMGSLEIGQEQRVGVDELAIQADQVHRLPDPQQRRPPVVGYAARRALKVQEGPGEGGRRLQREPNPGNGIEARLKSRLLGLQVGGQGVKSGNDISGLHHAREYNMR